MTTIKVEHGGERIEATPGEEITLEVSGAGTTGYLWQLQSNSDEVQIVDHEVASDEQSFGGVGVERFVVKPLRAGTATLHLELKAPWEEDAAESYEVEVHSVADE